MIITTAQMYEKINDFGNAFGQVHRACKKIFDLWYTKIKDKYGEKETLEQQGKLLFWWELRKHSCRDVMKICSKFKGEH